MLEKEYLTNVIFVAILTSAIVVFVLLYLHYFIRYVSCKHCMQKFSSHVLISWKNSIWKIHVPIFSEIEIQD